MNNSVKMMIRGSLIAMTVGLATVSSAASQNFVSGYAGDAAPVEHPIATAAVAEARSTADNLMRQAVAAEEARLAFENEIASLRPGQYLWRPERASTGGPVEIVISLEAQQAYVYRAGTLIAATTVSTGRAGHRTPTGSFTILQKNRRHFSNLYDNAPMPNMQRLTWDGIALHAGALPGYPASHGCVRLPMEFSRRLFDITSMGGRVHIVQDAPPSAEGALAFARAEQSGGTQMASAAR